MRWIDWAFSTQVPTAEKLVLVYLASRANYAGVGLLDRDELAQLTGYEKRSVQRLLKSLRDSKHLTDGGPWYVLSVSDPGLAPATIDALPPPMDGQNLASPGGLPMRSEPLLSDEDIEEVGRRLSAHLVDGAEFLMDQLNNFEARLGHLLARSMPAVHVEPPPLPPPPDPVKEHPLYEQLCALMPESQAYELVKHQMQMEQQGRQGETTLPKNGTTDSYFEEVAPYSETAEGRFLRVWGILHDKPPNPEAELDLMRIWHTMEADENKFTVKGETTTAFEQLYPAIVEAAKQRRNLMTMREFLDPVEIAGGRAPWDQDPRPAPAEDTVLSAEINTMLVELAAANDPRCTVQPRTVEKLETGGKVTESIVGYHRRVKAKHREMQKLKTMGVI